MARAGALLSETVAPSRVGGRYVVEATLGKGGMGAVYRVRDESTGTQVALKQMTWDGEDSAQLRFRREFHTMANLKHPRIVQVFDYGVADGKPYYTLELLDGQDLHDLDKVPWKRACELLRDVASALAFLHARRLLHRDLAPRNVRCTTDGRAKLIDFGVLATTGITGDIAGTPPLMAPESLHGRPLDHRYDLYGLGALAYRILTGKHAFPARTIEQLEAAWRERPAPPSSYVECPQALDDLVFALLAHDPLARPPSAADVIDRLSVIADLPREAGTDASRGWLASAALVGRQREMQQIKRAVARTVDGDGRSIVIEAPSGTGKSRLLRELALEAQLVGASVVRADSDAAGRGAYAILQELARGLFAAVPAEAEAAAQPRLGTLARVLPIVRERLGAKAAKPHGDPAQDRMLVQDALAAWVLDIARTKPIALLVDDVQRCDEASAAVLAALAHGATGTKLLVGVALRSDETVRAAAAIASIVDAGNRLRLRGLDEEEVGELCKSLFGNAPHLPRLAHWMHQAAGGSPLYTTELARHLVERDVIRYRDGMWLIPEDPAHADIPKGLADAMDARVRALPAGARSLGEALSVHGGEIGLPLVVALADTRDEEAIFAALDQLAYEEVLVQAGEGWRFRHDGLREALLRGLSDGRRKELHLRIGTTLAASGEASAGRDAEIGWHLLRGGDRAGGATRLERAGRALYASQSFTDCITPLEAALGVLDEQRSSARVKLELRHMLLMAGCMADRKAALRNAEPCVEGYRYWSGMDVAASAKRYVGRHLGVLLGLTWAAMRWVFTPRRGPNPYEAFRTFFIVVGYTATIYSLMMDMSSCSKVVDLVDPIAILKRRVPYAVYLLTRNTLEYSRGRTGIVRRNSRALLDILENDRITPISDIDRRTGAGGARYMLVLIAVSNLDPAWEQELAELAKIDLQFFDIGGENVKVINHRLRGEEEAASEVEARVELRLVQLGSVWQMESFMPIVSSFAYAFARDTLGLRRSIEELARLCADGFSYDAFLQLARGEYLRERGDAEASLVELEPLLERSDWPMLQIPAIPACAETLLALGYLERAAEVARKGVTLGADPDQGNLNGELRSIRALALAEAALGQHEPAAQRLDEAIVRATPLKSLLMTGSLHEARARVALAASDSLGYHKHLAETEFHFRETKNPVLVARAERLSEAGKRAAPAQPSSIVAFDAVTTPPPSETKNWVSAVLSGCRGSSERATRALALIINESRAGSGFLFLRSAGQLVLAAPAWGQEPPFGLADAVSRALQSPDDPVTVIDIRQAGEIDKLDWKPVPLALRVGDRTVIVGGAAVIAGALKLKDPDPSLLAEIARELFEAGDVTHTRTLA